MSVAVGDRRGVLQRGFPLKAPPGRSRVIVSVSRIRDSSEARQSRFRAGISRTLLVRLRIRSSGPDLRVKNVLIFLSKKRESR